MKANHGVTQFTINYICSCLLVCQISTTKDLGERFENLIEQINQNPDIFKGLSVKQVQHILKVAINVYNEINALKIRFDPEVIKQWSSQNDEPVPHTLVQIPTNDDLSRVTRSYDRLSQAHKIKKVVQTSIPSLLEKVDHAVFSHIIIGTGDTGTTLWLEKYKEHHETTASLLAEAKLPPVLMIGNSTGSWKHNYTLAQPHNILERAQTRENPSAYLSTAYYLNNPYANGRHVFQSNQVNLANTQAPLVHATVLKIEKKENHLNDWADDTLSQNYRVLVEVAGKVKTLYTSELNICTGLGPARNAIAGKLLSNEEFKRLNTWSETKKFTPIVDGNQFILTGTEEQGTGPRTIVIYGGGGTAAAVYRKGFFGNDIRTEGREFSPKNQANTVFWIAKQFDKAGTGKLATTALKTAKERDELVQGELVEITQKSNGKLVLLFQKMDNPSETFEKECDQLVYSIGQDDSAMKQIYAEIEPTLTPIFDEYGMILNVSSPDGKVVFFGAAAMAIRETEYSAETWKWLHKENIGGDVGPGSMPPSRAQIKRYNFLNGIQPESINANMDSQHLIIQYLEKAGADHSNIMNFIKDLLEARKHSTAGCKRDVLNQLLITHNLQELIDIQGHGHLVHKSLVVIPSVEVPQTKSAHSLLSWLNKNKKKTNDANVLLSTVDAPGTSMDDTLKETRQALSTTIKIYS
ncbi:hypothetical protein [Legionella saoudiensis]|uniref:hypothetical protein n=1 Tax=Legionella saoudiensis TaxID=1750561 RepID=UPI00072FBB96|nr:hypothetical protein [Legionella saoudiensis]